MIIENLDPHNFAEVPTEVNTYYVVVRCRVGSDTAGVRVGYSKRDKATAKNWLARFLRGEVGQTWMMGHTADSRYAVLEVKDTMGRSITAV